MQFRPADISDVLVVARVFRVSFRHTYPQFPELHTPEEDCEFFSTMVFPQNQVYVAEMESGKETETAGELRIVGFIAFTSEMVNHLYLLPEATDQGVGSSLLDIAKQQCGRRLRLWTFQCNQRARNFYTKHGFAMVEETDGAANEERQPDVLYEFTAPSLR